MRVSIRAVVAGFAVITFTVIFFQISQISTASGWRDRLRSPRYITFSISEQMGSRNVAEVVQPNVRTVIMEPSVPLLKGTIKRPFAVVLVLTMGRYFNQRQTIRKTWGKWAKDLNILVFFFIGSHDSSQKELQILEAEQQIHNDLIVDDFEEGYYKLPGKVLRMLKWFHLTYSHENYPRYLIKVDQDVFLNLPNMVKTLTNTSYYQNLMGQQDDTLDSVDVNIPDNVNQRLNTSDPTTYFIGGKKWTNPKVDNDRGSKWYMNSAERAKLNWVSPQYPDYVNGPCYIMSGNIVSNLYDASFSVPVYPFEDVYVVGMIANHHLGLFVSNVDGMVPNLDELKKLNKLDEVLTVHPVDHPNAMIKLCQKLKNCKSHLQKKS